MSYRVESEYLNLLRDRINLDKVPFSERGSRLMIFRSGDTLAVRLAERWFKLDSQLSTYRRRAPILTDGRSPTKLGMFCRWRRRPTPTVYSWRRPPASMPWYSSTRRRCC